jgi:hypothetical protein
MVGLYLVSDEGVPFRCGFCLGNEFSDHVTERQNYLYLAHSKLRNCSFGPELLVGELPSDIQGMSRIYRGDKVNLSHSRQSAASNSAASILSRLLNQPRSSGRSRSSAVKRTCHTTLPTSNITISSTSNFAAPGTCISTTSVRALVRHAAPRHSHCS